MSAAPAPREISADDFVALVKLLKRGPSLPVRVIGSVSLVAWRCDRNLHFRNVDFAGDFNAENADLSGLAFENCSFAGRLDCSNITLSGGFSLSGCRFDRLPNEEDPLVKLDCGEIGGTVQISVDGATSANNCVIDGDLLIAAPREARAGLPPRLQLDNAKVRGAIEINTAKTRPPFSGSGSLALAAVSLTGASCARLAVDNTTVAAAAAASGLQGASSDRFDFSTVESSGDVLITKTSAREIVGFGCSAGGTLRLTASPDGAERVTEMINLAGVVVGGQIEITGEQIEDNPGQGPMLARLPARHLTLRGASCDGLIIADADFAETIEISALKSRNFVILNGVTAKSLSGYGPSVGNLFRITRSATAESRIQQELVLWGAEVKGQLDIAAAEWIGMVRAVDCALGSLWIGSDPSYRGPEPPPQSRPSVSIGGLEAADSRFNSFVRMTRLQVVSTEGSTADNPGGMRFLNCVFASDFSTWTPRRNGLSTDGADRTFVGGWEADNCVTLDGDFVMRDCSIARTVDLTRLVTGAGLAGGDMVLLDGTRIEGDLRLASPISVCERTDVSPQAAQAAAREHRRILADPSRALEIKALTSRLSLTDVEAGGVDLSGLSLRRSDDDPRSGHIDARRIQVRGILSLYAHAAGGHDEISDGVRFAYASVPGSVRLDSAKIGEFRVTAHSFRDGPASEAAKKGSPPGTPHSDGLVLEAAQIDVLRVPQLASLCEPIAAGCNAFPVPLDLAGLKVGHWFFTEEETGDPCKHADTYLDFLDNDEGLHRDVYHSVAATLRNMGEDGEAEKILFNSEYRAERSRHNWYELRGSGRIRPMLGLGLTRRPLPRAPLPTRDGSPDGGLPASRPAGDRIGAGLLRRAAAAAAWTAGHAGRPFRRLANGFDRVFLRYRRNPIGLALVALLLFLLSLPAAIDPRNFELADSTRLVAALNCERGGTSEVDYVVSATGSLPNPSSWSWGDALWTSLRYHIPVVGIAARGDFEASDNDRLYYGFGGYAPDERTLRELSARRCSIDADAGGADRAASRAGMAPRDARFTAADWFGLMALANWIIWPLILTFLLRRLLRSN